MRAGAAPRRASEASGEHGAGLTSATNVSSSVEPTATRHPRLCRRTSRCSSRAARWIASSLEPLALAASAVVSARDGNAGRFSVPPG